MPKGVKGFQKGKSGNPDGRPSAPDEQKEANRLTKTMILEILGTYLSMRMDTLNLILKDDTKPVLHRMVASIAKIAIETGDHQRLNFFMDRLIGKVTDKIEHKGATPLLIEYSDGASTLLASKEVEEE